MPRRSRSTRSGSAAPGAAWSRLRSRSPRTGRGRVAPVPGGDGFTASQRHQIDKAIRGAETVCRYEFSVYVGPAEGDPREFAERLHGALVAPDRSVLIMVDPVAHALEVVTGAEARRELEDHEVRLAVAEM